MVNAAIHGVRTSVNDRTTFLHKVGDYLEPEVIGLYVRQMKYLGMKED